MGHVVVAAPRGRMLTGTIRADRFLKHWRGRWHGRSPAEVPPTVCSVIADAPIVRPDFSPSLPTKGRGP